MTRTLAPRVLAASAALALSLGLAACAGDDPAETAAPTTPAAASPEPTTEPTTTEQPAIGASCEDVLAPDAYAKLEADGLETRNPDPIDPVAQRIVEDGGIACAWVKPQTDIMLALAHATGVDEGGWTTALAEAGYAQADGPVAGAWTGPAEPGSGVSPIVVLADGTITWVSAPDFAQWVRPAS
ncbi:hypothetical protein [Agromyces sp. C10]|uniref:hypothetical protein n=1 Tax=Agromyces sp. C10 TaxID=2935077 RepID=UPI00200B29A0|nr:hypothetical protein [Agromyces sp. C10]MCK8609605.1 hypothetical protein [Agromyces sp. C10]